jgi:hypothetical protein
MPKRGSQKIARIQRTIDKTITIAGLEIRYTGGPPALDEYLHHTLAHLIGISIAEQGQDKAVELMVHGWQIAEAYTPEQAA